MVIPCSGNPDLSFDCVSSRIAGGYPAGSGHSIVPRLAEAVDGGLLLARPGPAEPIVIELAVERRQLTVSGVGKVSALLGAAQQRAQPLHTVFSCSV